MPRSFGGILAWLLVWGRHLRHLDPTFILFFSVGCSEIHLSFCTHTSIMGSQMVSTGRGGAGNIVSQSETLQQQKAPSPTPESDKKVFYSTGRGGAGNIKSSSSLPSPKLVPQGSNTPALTGNKFSTGRGGYGNMVDNDNPDLTRKLQDVDSHRSPKENDLQAVSSNKSFSVGRGGFGNVISHTRSHGSSVGSGSNNLYTVVSHGDRDGKRKSLMLKVKGLFGS